MGVLRSLGVVALLATTACAATDWQRVYAGGKTAAEFIDRTHERGWSEPLGERVDHCEATLPESATEDDVTACLGPFAVNPQVVAALERYNAAADVLAAALLATDPAAKDQSAVLDAWGDVLVAARDLLVLFPEGERFARQLDAITRRAP